MPTSPQIFTCCGHRSQTRHIAYQHRRQPRPDALPGQRAHLLRHFCLMVAAIRRAVENSCILRSPVHIVSLCASTWDWAFPSLKQRGALPVTSACSYSYVIKLTYSHKAPSCTFKTYEMCSGHVAWSRASPCQRRNGESLMSAFQGMQASFPVCGLSSSLPGVLVVRPHTMVPKSFGAVWALSKGPHRRNCQSPGEVCRPPGRARLPHGRGGKRRIYRKHAHVNARPATER